MSQTAINRRPFGVTALSIFFFAATVITLVAAVSSLFPNGFLESVWKLNPRARTTLGAIGIWPVLLFSVICLACAVAAVGLWRGARYGYATAITVLTINSLGDLFNVISGTEPRGIIGIPIVIGDPCLLVDGKGQTILPGGLQIDREGTLLVLRLRNRWASA